MRVSGILRRLSRWPLALGALAAAGPPARACPFCDGGPGGTNPVKDAVQGDGFWWNLFCTALPFAALLAATALIHFGLPGRRGGRGGEGV